MSSDDYQENPDSKESSTPARPDWLEGTDVPLRGEGDSIRPTVPSRLRLSADSVADESALPEEGAELPLEEDAAAAEPAPTGPVAWKAAASSIPKLRQKPAVVSQPEMLESFPGFAQDSMTARNAAAAGAPDSGEVSSEDAVPALTPLDHEPPFWAEWLERVRYLPRPVLIGVGLTVVVGVSVYMLWPRETPHVALAQIRQHPEAYEGRSVRVGGRAGEAFSIGGRYVFNLLQGRDTVVVYSRTRRPRLHERVTVDGVVSIGYLEGSPRVAVLEDPAAPTPTP